MVSRDAVTDVTILDGVGARAVGGGGSYACHSSASTILGDLRCGGNVHWARKGSATRAATTELANMASNNLEGLRRL